MSTYERDPNTGNLNLIDGMRSVDDVKALMLELCYPVGSIYISTKNVSPQTFLGGTWKSKSGYMLRGATSSVTFNSNANDGGADSVTVSSVASHNHTQDSHQHASKTLTGTFEAGDSQFHWNWYGSGICSVTSATKGYMMARTGSNLNLPAKLTINATHQHDGKVATNQANGSNYTVNTLPKYKNVYMWERTA